MLPLQRKLISAMLVGLLVVAVVRAEDYQGKARHYGLTLPKGWEVIPPEKIAEANQTVGQRLKEQKISYDTGFQLKGRPAITHPYILVQWIPGGNSGTYDNIERNLPGHGQGAVKKVEGAFSDLMKGLSVGEFALDRQRNRVTTRYEADVDGIGKVQGIGVGFLGKDGTVFLHCYDRESAFRDTLPAFETIANSFRYEPGYVFQPSWWNWNSPALLGATAGGIVGAIVGGILVIGRWWKKKTAAQGKPVV